MTLPAGSAAPAADALGAGSVAQTPSARLMAHRRRPWLSRHVVVPAILLGVAAPGFLWWNSRRGAAISYVTAAVTRGPVIRAVTASGTVNPVLNVQVGTYVSGVITALYCDFNTTVRTGQICAKIDPRPYQTIVDQEQANLATAKAQLTKDQANVTYDKLSYDRLSALQKHDYVTQDSVDRTKNAYDQSVAQIQLDQAGIEQHRAALSAAEVNLGYTNIVSPVNGTVVSRNVTMGQTVAASFQTPTLFVIATDLTKMEVDANVSESDIGAIRPGDTTSFTVEAFPDHLFIGDVLQVRQAPQSVQNVITYDVVIGVANPDLLLKPGMTATCRIVTARRDQVLRVPDLALRYSPDRLAAAPAAGGNDHGEVWLLRQGRLVRVPVAPGLDDDSYSEIVNGSVKEGDVVITSERPAGTDGSGVARPHL